MRDDTQNLSGAYWYESAQLLAVSVGSGRDSLRLQLRRVNADSMPVFSLPIGWH